MANIITCIRIVLSFALLFCTSLSSVFYAMYIAAGFSDMIDGAVARKTGTVSEFGSRLDTFADIVFTVVCLMKLLPVLKVPVWLYVWILAIALIKLSNIAIGYIKQKMFVAVHSVMNKVTGCLLFILPLTLPLIDLKTSVVVVCFVATIAAVYEWYLIQAGRTI
ncbi:CDP-alcohol phosphatidyltransferase family protein [Butyrivibrio sp. M55]|uniref:CDP-alcohol phosphatidyltransferase family protein n=1 Tax=Butyrivibrio sp. M55 TaxID=1855323 RepID=UPI0008E2C1A2|nr:CDP-alcohol phosphatidyltransferase family protein [Butyrivibrio sp. M55]SFU94165.1 CDP-diacylglycerol--glycerol-3-phosphate 3-phosphatidyltransferase [Butyrivibrio sp. M55]